MAIQIVDGVCTINLNDFAPNEEQYNAILDCINYLREDLVIQNHIVDGYFVIDLGVVQK